MLLQGRKSKGLYADLINRDVTVPGYVFHNPGLTYPGRVIKPDSGHPGSLIVKVSGPRLWNFATIGADLWSRCIGMVSAPLGYLHAGKIQQGP
jgi:hypothetical protein